MFKKTGLISLGILLSVAAHAGGEVSGGADSFVVAPAFFTSPHPDASIDVCYEIASNFGVNSTEIETEIRWAFQTWGNYISSKDLTYAISARAFGIVSKLKSVHSGCRGNEDLKVYFGVSNSEVEKFRPRFIDPYAFSAVVSTSADGNWSKGFLWVAGPGAVDPQRKIPTWNLNSPVSFDPDMTSVPFGALKFTLLHEIGHIFGNGHVDNTIMTSRIGQWLEDWTSPLGDGVGGPYKSDLQIDQDIELVPNLNLADAFVLSDDPLEGGSDTHLLAKAFATLFGKSPQGKVTATAIRLKSHSAEPHSRPEEGVDPGTGPVVLSFKDQSGTYSAQIITTAKISEKDDSTPLFNGQYGDHYLSFGASFIGYIDAPTGRIEVLVNYNMDRRFSVINLSGGNSDTPMMATGFDVD